VRVLIAFPVVQPLHEFCRRIPDMQGNRIITRVRDIFSDASICRV
jgi:hypothetical protein